MQAPAVTKYGFRIRTRIGMVIDNLTIPARDEDEAMRKLRQIYRDCEVLECVCQRRLPPALPASFEDVVSLITR